MKLSIVTPWKDTPDFIPSYEATVQGVDQLVIIDNASEPDNADALKAMVGRVGGTYIRNGENRWFSPACNQGYKAASGDVIMFLNSDVAAPPGWLDAVRRDVVKTLTLYGPSRSVRQVATRPLVYLEGWCVAAMRETWELLMLHRTPDYGPWDEVMFARPYWDDNDLSFRAVAQCVPLVKTHWQISHLNNGTSRNIPGAYDWSEPNKAAFEKRVRAFYGD